MVTIFHGSIDEVRALNVAAWNHCTCDPNGLGQCPTHAAMVNSQRFNDGLLFARHHWATTCPGAGMRIIRPPEDN